MGYLFFSKEWAQQAIDNVNADKAFFKASQGFDSDFLFTAYADPARGVKEDLYVYNTLQKGKAGGVEVGVKKDAAVSIEGPYQVWKEVVEGGKDPIKAIMNKEFIFQGDLKKVMKYMKAVKLLMDNVQKVPTDWHSK